MKYMFYGLIAVVLMSGCSRHLFGPDVDVSDLNDTKPTGTMYQQRSEGLYKLKAEPYSVKHNKKDPELLGPQSTMSRRAVEHKTVIKKRRATKQRSSMTRSECISMVGKTKFNQYSKRFGGEKGVLKRCTIIKKLRKR